MKKRKVIGCIVNSPESEYQSRVLDGLISQCEAYDYDMAVFSPLVDVTHYFKDYMHGDQNILYLANFDYIDAVVVASTPLLSYNGGMEAIEKVKSILSRKCKKPVIMMDSPVDDYEVVETDDAVAMEQMTAHGLDVHGCNPNKIYFLTGAEGHVSSLKRMAGCEREYKKRGYEIKPENVFYGDFWYTAGYALADRIISGELEKPEAVIVHSDHMAMGVINRLSENGIRVPEDVIVTGYDATEEGIMNKISVTSFTPRVSDMAASAIDRIHAILEPDSPMKPHAVFKDDIRLASSCGCGSSVDYLMHYLENAAYKQNIDYTQGFIQDNNNVSLLMESYMMEEISQSESFEACLRRIYMRTYLLRPYDHFYICLRENWLDMNFLMGNGYPEHMSCVIHSMPEEADDSKYGMSIWKNLFRHQVITEKNLLFRSEREVYSEDALFMVDFISHIKKATGIKEAFYNYCRNEDSISKSYKKDKFEKTSKVKYNPEKPEENNVSLKMPSYIIIGSIIIVSVIIIAIVLIVSYIKFVRSMRMAERSNS